METRKHLRARTDETVPITDREGLVAALQEALALEHAIIPVYLYSLLSLDRERNREVAATVRSVVIEEMLHMALVGNVLNSVGATPAIGGPGFVPRYPARLPGGVLPDLTVSLRRCSAEHVKNVFLAIERPHSPVDHSGRRALRVLEGHEVTLSAQGDIIGATPDVLSAPQRFFETVRYEDHTIGWLYQRIATAMIQLDRKEDLFTGDPGRQVVWPGAPGRLYRVTDLPSALWALVEIIRQGEGTVEDPTVGALPADPTEPPPMRSPR
ncbi:ferritin-like protein [Streptomyces sp. NPDC046557]|uniref:ferritin-like domain-containing protein n=1 Tax=Streptomyces sp. NPDC046557 TaxID=3155372 RepID=UPI0033F7D087